ncbi:hypothetical protein JD969_02305 [Planctomycetota bacterium]|nr:hypothetical protein JD969_02305 [Planctomycetota bacterium]
MKALAVVFILVVLALVGLYYGGGFANLDPVEQQKNFENNIKVGMSWADVVDERAPRKFIPINPEARLGYGPELKFKKDEVEDNVKNNVYKDGFIFIYAFSANEVTEVFFDEKGNISNIHHPKTVKDLFNGTMHQ